jgi:hypothetical protein
MSTAISTTGFGGLAQANAVEFSRKNETKVSIPGQGRTTWVWDTVIGTQTANTLDGLAVVVTPPQLDVWPYEGTAKSGVSPYMRSLDGVKAYIVGKDAGDLDLSALEAAKLPIDADGLQPYACEKIPAFGWQTVQGRQKRRAKETSTIAILREGEAYPLFLQLSTTSSVEVRNFFVKLARAGIPHWRAVVSLGLKSVPGPGANYAVVVPKFLKEIDAESGAAVKAGYTDVVTPKVRGSIRPPRDVEGTSTETLDAAGVPF